jgi:ABC-type multidrug transport system ATPase subunit
MHFVRNIRLMPNIPNRVGESAGGSGEDPSTATGPAGEPVLRAKGLEKTYESAVPFLGRTVEVLDGASLELAAGEIVGVVGANGSGTSTLLQVLVGALDADAGTVECGTTVGWCPQETLLYDRLTVRETFELFGEAYAVADERVRERRDDLAARLDFERFLDYRVDHLSGGNRQKVNLAVALLHDPDVLMLDEPYTGFDWETYLAFWNLTEELVDRGTAIVVISHLISERERFDRILELRDGRLHEQDEPPEARSSAHAGASADGDGIDAAGADGDGIDAAGADGTGIDAASDDGDGAAQVSADGATAAEASRGDASGGDGSRGDGSRGDGSRGGD